MFMKILDNQFVEKGYHMSLYTLAIGWIKPNNLFYASISLTFTFLLGIFQSFFHSSIYKTVLLFKFCFIKYIFTLEIGA